MADASEAEIKRVLFAALERGWGPEAALSVLGVGHAGLTRLFAYMGAGVPDEGWLALALFLDGKPGDAATIQTEGGGAFVFLATLAGFAIEAAFRAYTSVFVLRKVACLLLLTLDRFRGPHASIGLPLAARPTLTLIFDRNPFHTEFFQTLVEV